MKLGQPEIKCCTCFSVTFKPYFAMMVFYNLFADGKPQSK